MIKNTTAKGLLWVISLLLLLVVFTWLLPNAYLFLYDSVFSYGQSVAPNAFIRYCVRNRFDTAKLTVLLGMIACESILLPMQAYQSKKKFIWITVTGAILIPFSSFLIFVGFGRMGISFLTFFVDIAPSSWPGITGLLKYFSFCLPWALLALAVRFRIMRYILCGLCALGTVWGSVVMLLASSQLNPPRYNAEFIVYLIWALLLCLYGWLRSWRYGWLIGIACTVLQACTALSFVGINIGGWYQSIAYYAMIILTSLSLVCLIIDTVMVFLSHRKAAIPATPGDPPAPAEE